MLDWTGERFVPWAREAALAYEHLHRYIWASTLVSGKRVLDLACGEGYGSHLLARAAATVVGIDLDGKAVAHARSRYLRSNLEFLQGDITSTGIAAAHDFDVIVCFEAIEHIDAHEALLAEVRRLLKPGGLFVVSTPNKDVYDQGREEANPFHVRELSFEELRALLSRHFERAMFLGQHVHSGSSMWLLATPDAGTVREFLLERGESDFQPASRVRLTEYVVAVAGDGALPAGAGSVLLDISDAWRKDREAELAAVKAAAAEAQHWFESRLRQRDEALEWREAQARRLDHDLSWLTGRAAWLEAALKARDEALEWRAGQVTRLEGDKDALHRQTVTALAEAEVRERELENIRQRLRGIEESRGWQWVLSIRRWKTRLLGSR
jgi:SAM-dependent methyltransferase